MELSEIRATVERLLVEAVEFSKQAAPIDLPRGIYSEILSHVPTLLAALDEAPKDRERKAGATDDDIACEVADIALVDALEKSKEEGRRETSAKIEELVVRLGKERDQQAALAAQVEALRESLSEWLRLAAHALVSTQKHRERTSQLLAATPADLLAAHDAQVRREALESAAAAAEGESNRQRPILAAAIDQALATAREEGRRETLEFLRRDICLSLRLATDKWERWEFEQWLRNRVKGGSE